MTESETETAPATGESEVKPGVAPTGGGFRAVATRGDGEVIWSCPHVHFTEHSAKNCPALREEGFA